MFWRFLFLCPVWAQNKTGPRLSVKMECDWTQKWTPRFLSRVCEGLLQPFFYFYFQRLNFTHPCRASRLTWCAALRECIPAGFSSHTQSGRRSACRTSCGWCFCRSSSADRDSTSRSSSWACFFSCPICVPPTGQRDRGQDHERDSLACATVLLSYLQ